MTSHNSAQNEPFTCSRRSLLRGAAVATAATAAGALLAACAPEETISKASAADIPVGGAEIIDDWIVSQPTEGEFLAFSTTCPHQGTTINKIEEKDGMTVAICPKHGSEFDTSNGDVLVGPARDPLSEADAVDVEGDSIEIRG